MKKSKFYVFMTLTFALSLVLGACGGGSKNSSSGSSGGSSKTKQVLNMDETAELPTGDPTLATDVASFTVFGNTMEGLYVVGKNDELKLGIAKAEPTVSKDGKTYTFKLREDAKWSTAIRLRQKTLFTPGKGRESEDRLTICLYFRRCH